MTPPSKKQVKKVASRLRKLAEAEAPLDQWEDALEVVRAQRARHAYPLVKVNNGLRSFISTLGVKGEVSQRLKRMETIIEKLTTRETTLRLDQMVDIGGCRIALHSDDLEELRRVEKKIRRTWASQLIEQRCRDYVAEPRESGYRAIHLVVVRDDCPIEIQLRSRRMHGWAQMMETFSQHFDENFKHDGVQGVIGDFGRLLSKAHQMQDGLYIMTDEERQAFADVSDAVTSLLLSTNREEG